MGNVTLLTHEQQIADELGGNLLSRAAEELLR